MPTALECASVVCTLFDLATYPCFDQKLDKLARGNALAAGTFVGVDNLSGAATAFEVRGEDFREGAISASTGSIARHRTIVCALSMALSGRPCVALPSIAEKINERNLRVYIAETSGALHSALTQYVRPELLDASAYFGEGYLSGEMVGGVRHEDLQALSLAEGSCDLVITSEVLEHVPYASLAEREIVRVLAPGGSYVFTVPLEVFDDEDVVLAERLDDGTLRFHGEPVYHGDPQRPEGILAYRIFSLTQLERRFDALGCTLATYQVWSAGLGILSADCIVHIARKRRV